MSLLGEDGLGYELARRLEAAGVWRTWLGDSLYSNFIRFLSSPAAWSSFMRPDLQPQHQQYPRSKYLLHLQLRARALLFDKASSASLSLPDPSSSAISRLNPNYLQLHGDDVYYTLENADHRRDGGGTNTASSKSLSKSSYGGLRYGESEMDKRFKNDELPETWYSQFIEKQKVSRPYRLSLGDREADKRSPEQMSNYLRVIDLHKRRRVAFKLDPDGSSNSLDEDVSFFPETMFMFNCVPDSAVPPAAFKGQEIPKLEFRGVLDSLPHTRSVMIERLGISVEQGGSLNRSKSGSLLGEEQAMQMSQKVVARMLTRVGFDGATEVPVEVFSQLLRCHICKLGRTLKKLADSYRKQCSAMELLKMFLQTAGYSNLGILMELVKDGTRSIVQPTQQLPAQQLPTQHQVHAIQSQLQSQHQNPLQLPQQLQMPRQMPPQLQQMVHPQNLALQQQQQQQLERLRRRQQAASRPAMEINKDRPLVQVKLEHPSEVPMDNNSFNAIQSRHPHVQMQPLRQQQLAAMSHLHAQSSNQFRQLASIQVPQVQSPNMGIVRAPPVKVEGFQELMGGDASLKHDSEENKLTSPSSK